MQKEEQVRAQILHPHAADVIERETLDESFSAGWCMHAKPRPSHYFDFHVHYGVNNPSCLLSAVLHSLISDMNLANLLDVQKTLLILRVCIDGKIGSHANSGIDDRIFDAQDFKSISNTKIDYQPFLAAWVPHDLPSPNTILHLKDFGCRAIKLHNSPIITVGAKHDIWLNSQWQECFEAIQETGMPVLWHVTQRLSASRYTGGGRNTYWKSGWEKGVSYNNQDLLDVFLECCKRFPNINFVGAHQLHLGWNKLSSLFTAHPNLMVDTSVGCLLHELDQFYPEDREFLQKQFIKWDKRILFATDHFWKGEGDDYNKSTILRHQHFISDLYLPESSIEDIAHNNSERILGIC